MLQRTINLRDLSDVVHEFIVTHYLLYSDLLKAMQPQDDDSREQTRRREAYRTAFACFEGTIYMMKQHALKAAVVFNVLLSEEEISIITERQARLTNKGRTEAAAFHPDTKSNFRFAFYILARCHNRDFELDVSGQSWEDFRSSHSVRNRLTHPKSRHSLEVTDDEILTLGRTSIWFAEQIGHVSKICVEANNKLREEFTLSNQAMLQELYDRPRESLARAAQTDQVIKLLEELRVQVDNTIWDERITEAKADLETIMQYFIGQMSQPTH